MSKKKNIRKRGKINFSRAFQEIGKGDAVTVVREETVQPSFPKRLQGRTGIVDGKRGRAIIIKVNEMNKEKTFIIDPIHLKKIKQIGKEQ